MSSAMVGLLFGIGVGGWAYYKLAQLNGNASPQSNAMAAGFIGLVAFIIMFTLFKFVIPS